MRAKLLKGVQDVICKGEGRVYIRGWKRVYGRRKWACRGKERACRVYKNTPH